jgi:putative membrane protein
MHPAVQAALHSWSIPVPLTLAVLLAAFLYMRGWFRLHSASVTIHPGWRAVSFLLGVFLIWVALGSPLATFDEESLTVHMLQHLLLMTIAPALILLGAPFMPLLHGLPQESVKTVLSPLFKWPPLQRIGHFLSQPALCWLAAAAALVGWHIPAAFTLGLQSEGWHIVEHACFLGAGFLFWWPVVQPWPSVPIWPRWSILLYLFLATLPCDVLSAFLVFSERVVYPAYFSTARHFGLSVLEDQECAGALMWTCITIIYLMPAIILTTRLLGFRNPQVTELENLKLHSAAVSSRDPQSIDIS